MLISEKKEFIYYHLYKVAGSSLRSVLIPFCSKRQVVMQNYYHLLKLLGRKADAPVLYQFHPRLTEVKVLLGRRFDEYYKFTFVRHPLDWQKSLYFFLKRNRLLPQHKIIEHMTFDEYISWRIAEDPRYMSDFITDEAGELLVDEIFHYESLYQDFKKLSERLGLQKELPHKNIAGYGKEVSLSRSTQELFENVFRKDYEIFNYAREYSN